MADTDDLKAHEELWRNFVKSLALSAAAVMVCLSILAIVLL